MNTRVDIIEAQVIKAMITVLTDGSEGTLAMATLLVPLTERFTKLLESIPDVDCGKRARNIIRGAERANGAPTADMTYSKCIRKS